MNPAEFSVAIVIVNWNGWRDTIDCVRSCLKLVGVRFTLVVCDNGSSDQSIEKIQDWALGAAAPSDPRAPFGLDMDIRPSGVVVLDRAEAEAGHGGDAQLVLIRGGGNLGFAGGNNVGLRWALRRGHHFAWLLNNDTIVPADALEKLVAVALADVRVGMCGSTLVEYFEPDRIQALAAAIDRRSFRGRHLGFRRSLDELRHAGVDDWANEQEILYPVGASILVSQAFLVDVGLMEESYFLYYEEADWVLRGSGRFRIAIAAESLVYHKGGASAGSTSQGTSSRSVAFLYRSRLLIARRFAPRALPYVVAGMIYEAARGLARGRAARAVAAARALTGRVKVPR